LIPYARFWIPFVQKPCVKYFGALHLFHNNRMKFYKDYRCSAPGR